MPCATPYLTAFTQGLVVEGGSMWESTGMYGTSSVRHVELATGRVLAQVDLDRSLFGEGLASFGANLYQLTWRERQLLVYDRATLRRLRVASVPFEGWGLTHNSESLILSDGSDTLYFLDPDSFAVRRRVAVRAATASAASGGGGFQAITRLNELEYIDGAVFANIWMEDRIAVIDPLSGYVRAFIDAGFVNPRHERPADQNAVLNGIAFEAEQRRLFITGKLWPLMYEISLPALP
jgi:glutamine cyclotransferase